MGVLTWSESMSVGNAELDADHRILIDLVRQLHDAKDTGQSHEVVGTILHVLAEYASHHFRREEELITLASFPDLNAHLAQHHAIENRLADICTRWKSGEYRALSEEVITFLKKWLTEHIQGADKSYRSWVEKLAAIPGATIDQGGGWSSR